MRQVAIIGGAWQEIPWEEDWDFWCCNALYESLPTERFEPDMISDDAMTAADVQEEADRLSALGYGSRAFPFDAWFQLHTPEYMEKHWAHGWPAHQLWLLREHDFPIYMQKEYKKYPSSVRFPKERIEDLNKFGKYHLFTFSWMVGLAIAEGYDRIGLFGVTGGKGEPWGARACLEFWLGFAQGKGIDVEVYDGEDLFHSKHKAVLTSDLQYAYDPEPAFELGDGWRDVR